MFEVCKGYEVYEVCEVFEVFEGCEVYEAGGAEGRCYQLDCHGPTAGAAEVDSPATRSRLHASTQGLWGWRGVAFTSIACIRKDLQNFKPSQKKA